MKPVAIFLVSGGLDSLLAAAVMREHVSAGYMLHFQNPFEAVDSLEYMEEAAEKLSFPLVIEPLGNDYLEIVKNPRHGYGKNLNPCLDCRILQFKKAVEFLKRKNADFIVTGEVLGQRPMSQNLRAMKLIEEESGAGGLIFRPLSARFLPPPDIIKSGAISLDSFPKIKGRSRKMQIELAKEYGINKYEPPAGGCLLTMKEYSRKLSELFNKSSLPTPIELTLFKIGRHFRISPENKLIVGRNQNENELLERIAPPDYTVIRPLENKGPTSIIDSLPCKKLLFTAAGISARYTDSQEDEKIRFIYYNGKVSGEISSTAFSITQTEEYRI